MTDSRLALVTGASGAVGPALVERLLREGQRVRVLSRRPTLASWPDGPVEIHAGDVTDRASVERAMAGACWVFHLAALLHIPRPTPELTAEYERVNVEGTRLVAETAARAGAERLVYFSTLSVYGATGGEAADEDSTPRPDSPYASTKLRGEEIVLDRHRRNGVATSVLRLAAVYGPHVKANYARLAAALRAGWFVPIGTGRNRRTLVHEADVALAAVLAARSARATGRVYNVSDGRIHPLAEVVAAICQALDRRPPGWHVPVGLARAAARLGDLALPVLGRAPRLVSLVDKYTEDVAVRADRIQRELGFHARYDLASGWRDALGATRARNPERAAAGPVTR